MSQPTDLCRNKVQAKLTEEIELCRDKEFFYRNIAKEVCEEDCRDTRLYSDIDQGKWRGTLSRQSLLYRNIKE